MSDQSDPLIQVSAALANRVAAAKTALVAIRLSAGRHLTGTFVATLVVTSDQSLTKRDEFEVVTADGSMASAKVGDVIRTRTSPFLSSRKLSRAVVPIRLTRRSARLF
jgi:hypothetical protein